jgi:hypothetical protein
MYLFFSFQNSSGVPFLFKKKGPFALPCGSGAFGAGPLNTSDMNVGEVALTLVLGGYIVNLCDFYFYKLIGKLTSFLQLQEFSFRNLPVTSCTTTVWCSLYRSNARLSTFSPRVQLYGLYWILMTYLSSWASKVHTHPSHSETSRLLTSSLSLGVPVPHGIELFIMNHWSES